MPLENFADRDAVKAELLDIENFNNQIHSNFENGIIDNVRFHQLRGKVDDKMKEVILWYIDYCGTYSNTSDIPNNRGLLWNIVYGHLKLTQLFRLQRGMDDSDISFWRDLEFFIKFKIDPCVDAKQPYQVDETKVNQVLSEVIRAFKGIFSLNTDHNAIKEFLRDKNNYSTLNLLVQEAKKKEFLDNGSKIIQNLKQIIQKQNLISEEVRIKVLYNIQLLGELYVKVRHNIDKGGIMKLLRDVRNRISDPEEDFKNNLHRFIRNLPDDDEERNLFGNFELLEIDLVKIEECIENIKQDKELNSSEFTLLWFTQLNDFVKKGKQKVGKTITQYSLNYLGLIAKLKDEIEFFINIIAASSYKDIINEECAHFILKDFNGCLSLNNENEGLFLPISSKVKSKYADHERLKQKFISHTEYKDFNSSLMPADYKAIATKLQENTEQVFSQILDAIQEGNKPTITVVSLDLNLKESDNISDIYINIRKSLLGMIIDASCEDINFWQQSKKLNQAYTEWMSMENDVTMLKFLLSKIARIFDKILMKVNDRTTNPTSIEIPDYYLAFMVACRNYYMHGLPLFEIMNKNIFGEFQSSTHQIAQIVGLKKEIDTKYAQYGWHARCDAAQFHSPIFPSWVGFAFRLYQEAENELLSSDHSSHNVDAIGGRVTPVLLP